MRLVRDQGTPFGNYVLLKRLARGGMAEVFLAEGGAKGFDRRVALKRILPHLMDSDDFVRMFHDEAKLAARLNHPNVVHIYEYGEVDNHHFIAMEFVDGIHTGALIEHGAIEPIPPTLVARIGADACAGLNHAHRLEDNQGNPLRLVHRDISPPNLMISYDGVVKVVDFGIAKAVDMAGKTRPGIVKGKFAYMSPEQTMGRKLDGRSDVFSLGIIIWEILAGRVAVDRTDPVEAMKTIRDGRLAPIRQARPDVPVALADVVDQALQVKSADRPTAAELGNAFEGFIKASPELGTAMQLSEWIRTRFRRRSANTEAATTTKTPEPTFPKERSSAPTPASGALASGSLTAAPAGSGGSSMAFLHNDDEPEQAAHLIGRKASTLPPLPRSQLGAPSATGTPNPAHRPGSTPNPAHRRGGTPNPAHLSMRPQTPNPVHTPIPRPGMSTHTTMPGHSGPRTVPVAPGLSPQRKKKIVIGAVVGALLLLLLIISLSSGDDDAATVSNGAAGATDAGTRGDATPDVLPDALFDALFDAGSTSSGASDAGMDAGADPDIDASIEEQTAWVVIKTVPEGARVSVDGSDPKDSPALFDNLAIGKHRVVIEMSGYKTLKKTVTLKPGVSELSYKLAKSRRRPKKGKLNVLTRPSCRAYLGKRALGTTPFAGKRIDAGTYTVTCKKPGYKTVKQKVRIRAGKTTKVKMTLKKK